MSNRLQIILNSKEYQLVKRISRKEGKSISEWVRGLIRRGFEQKKQLSEKDPIATLSHLSLPTPSISQILEEIEQGRQ